MSRWNESAAGVVVLPDGRCVRGRALRNGLADGDELPQFGLYLTAEPRSEERWESRWVMWRDFRLPHSPRDALAALRDAHERSASSRVEIACAGGMGRTGTAIALLARYAGVPSSEAVAWVRANYDSHAVETPWQRRFVARVDLAP